MFSETMNALICYSWPGNIREMQTVNERAVILLRGSILHKPSVDLKSQSGEVQRQMGSTRSKKAEKAYRWSAGTGEMGVLRTKRRHRTTRARFGALLQS